MLRFGVLVIGWSFGHTYGGAVIDNGVLVIDNWSVGHR